MITLVSSPKQHLPKDMQNSVWTLSFFSRPQCIDTYCMNTDEGRAQREEAKAKYLASLSKAKTNLANLDFTPNKNLTIQEQVDMIMSELQLKQKKRKTGEPEVI